MLRIVAPTLMVLFSTANSFAATSRGEIVAIYSDLCFHDEAGDILGTRILLFESYLEYYVVYEQAQGWLESPVIARASVDGDSISFVLPPDGVAAGFTVSGTLSPEEFSGRMNNPMQSELRLPRQENNDVYIPHCGAEN